KPLDPNAIEKPWRIGRNVRRLIGPVIEVVITEKTDVGNEYSRVHVESVVYVEVVPAIGLRDIFVGASKIPLPRPALASLRGVVTANIPSMVKIRPRTFCQWKSPPTLICSTWTSLVLKISVEPPRVSSLGWLKSIT